MSAEFLSSFPKKFRLKSNLVSAHHRITVEAMDGTEIGSFHKEIISAHDHYHLSDAEGNSVASAKKALVSFGAEYNISSKLASEKWSIQEKKLSSKVHIGDVYIITKNGVEVASCKKTDIVHNKITVEQTGSGECAVMKKAWKSLHDTWKVSVRDTSDVASWVVGFFAAMVQIEDDD